MSFFCLKPCLKMYFRHLELRGSCFNTRLQETGFERHLKHRTAFWTTKKVFKTCCQKGCTLKRASKRAVRLPVRLSVPVSVQSQQFENVPPVCTYRRCRMRKVKMNYRRLSTGSLIKVILVFLGGLKRY